MQSRTHPVSAVSYSWCIAAIVVFIIAGLVWWTLRTPPIVRAIRDQDYNALQTLINRGNGLESTSSLFLADNFSQFTPLLWACNEQDATSISMLIDAGANVSYTEPKFNRNALHVLFSSARMRPTTECVRLLVLAGVPVDAPQSNGDTPLISAIGWKDAAALQIMLGSSKLDKSQVPLSKLLWQAIWVDSPQVVQVLLDHGADPREEMSPRVNSLEYATSKDKSPEVIAILERAMR
jgi:ankyrin repeat protein